MKYLPSEYDVCELVLLAHRNIYNQEESTFFLAVLLYHVGSRHCLGKIPGSRICIRFIARTSDARS